MPDILKYGGIFGRGVTATFAPSIFKGAVLELFREQKIDREKVTEWVLANNSLWDSIELERKRQFKHLAGKVGDVSWMSVDWVISALKDDFPAVASLFLGWTKGKNWLARQIEEIKTELQN